MGKKSELRKPKGKQGEKQRKPEKKLALKIKLIWFLSMPFKFFFCSHIFYRKIRRIKQNKTHS